MLLNRRVIQDPMQFQLQGHHSCCSLCPVSTFAAPDLTPQRTLPSFLTSLTSADSRLIAPCVHDITLLLLLALSVCVVRGLSLKSSL